MFANIGHLMQTGDPITALCMTACIIVWAACAVYESNRRGR